MGRRFEKNRKKGREERGKKKEKEKQLARFFVSKRNGSGGKELIKRIT